MADNVTLDAGSGGAVIGTDEDTVASHHVQWIKLKYGGDGTFTIVEASNGLPVQPDSGGFDVTNAGTFQVQISGDALTALQLIDNAIHVDDAAYTLGTDSGVMMMGFAGTQSVNANDAGAIAIDTDGAVHISDGGNAITVDGTVTANPASGTIDTVTTVTAVTDITNPVTVNITDTSFAVADGNALGEGILIQGDDGTDRKNINVDATTGNVQVDLGATDNAVLDNIQTAVDTVAAAVSTEMQVDVVGALPAGTNAIGKLAANTGVDIGDVDVTSVVPGTGATNLGKAEDAAHTTGDTGVMALGVRNDDLAALAGADGDYAPLQVTENGALLVCMSANDDIKYARLEGSSSGDNQQIVNVASRKIRVLAVSALSNGTVTMRFEDGLSTGTYLTGAYYLTAQVGFVLPYNPAGWFETSVNVALNMELSAAINVNGSITYIEVP